MFTPLPAATGLILTAFVLLQQMAFWQRKEYRRDRAWAGISLAAQMRNKMLLGVFAVAVVMVSFLNESGWLGLVLLAVVEGYTVIQRGIVRPRPTQKVLVIAV